MKNNTAMEEFIQWAIGNAFNITGQDGVKYIAIDYEEMRLKFDEWLEKEKRIIVEAYNKGQYNALIDVTGEQYYTQTFKKD